MSKEYNGEFIVEDIHVVKWSKYMKRSSILFISKV